MSQLPVTQSRWDFLLLLGGLLVVWQVLAWIAGDVALAPPVDAAVTLWRLFVRPIFWGHVQATGIALGYSVILSMLGGAAIGSLLGLNRLAGAVAEPILVSLYSLPKVTLYPLVLLVFGLGLPAKVAFGAMHGLVPVAIVVMNAILHLRPSLLRTARVLRLSPLATLWHIVLPAIRPQLAAALRLGFSLSLLGVLIGEMFASQRGLGFLVMNAMGMNDTGTIMAVAIVIAAVAVVANRLLGRLERAR